MIQKNGGKGKANNPIGVIILQLVFNNIFLYKLSAPDEVKLLPTKYARLMPYLPQGSLGPSCADVI
ncbi:hypothetical protein B6N13_05450 [Marinomonas sp. UCMA 3892]|uniref:hypothetical protein n=1 Tax=unclassified Marinomonas TaxID=196814 RepID=UPI00146EB5D4|nr:hypothetical protein [Marinomonas sp. UCMA 3892]NLU97549.1 hypothetical protein [Marinomonas sp. UCMA 3892]